jgi:hypothetical protein
VKRRTSFFMVLLFFLTHNSEAIQKSFRLGYSLSYIPIGFSQDKLSPLGIFSRYEFRLNKNFALGIQSNYRFYNGKQKLHQFNYGLVLQHHLSNKLEDFYISYGLLMQMLKLSNISGYGVAHDTRFAIGYQLSSKNPYFIELAYHISRLRHFADDNKNLDHFTVSIGRAVDFSSSK